jgi:hypothetical protein
MNLKYINKNGNLNAENRSFYYVPQPTHFKLPFALIRKKTSLIGTTWCGIHFFNRSIENYPIGIKIKP